MAVATGAGLAVLLAGVALLHRGAEQERPPEASAPAGSKQKPSGTTTRTTHTGVLAAAERPDAPQFEGTLCWQELERFNEEVSIDTFRAWATPLLASGDALVRDYLRERLTELIGNDAGRALEVMEWARESQGRETGVYLLALRDSEAVHLPQVSSKLLDMGLDSRLETSRRAGVLSALDTQKRFGPAALDRLGSFAKDPASGEAGWAAARTIGRVLKRDLKEHGNAAPYLEKLAAIGLESPDEPIRYLGQMMPMHSSPILDEKSFEQYAKILTTEGNPDGRSAAAINLAVSEDKQKVLDLFSSTFETEPSECVRWALFRFSARAAGPAALPAMAHMAMTDPRFQPLYQGFEQIYASGVVDFSRVWNSLPNQDPFYCEDRHE